MSHHILYGVVRVTRPRDEVVDVVTGYREIKGASILLWQEVRRGDDLLALGLRGPEVGRILDTLLERVLDDPALNERERLLALAREAR